MYTMFYCSSNQHKTNKYDVSDINKNLCLRKKKKNSGFDGHLKLAFEADFSKIQIVCYPYT